MPLPAAVSTGTVTGQLTRTNGDPASGSGYIKPRPRQLLDASDNVVLTSIRQDFELDVTGSFSIEVVATDDPDLNPVNFTLEVVVELDRQPNIKFDMYLPGGTTVDIADAMPVPASEGDPIVVGPPGPPGSGAMAASAAETAAGTIATKWVSPDSLRDSTITDVAPGGDVEYIGVGPNRRLPDDVRDATEATLAELFDDASTATITPQRAAVRDEKYDVRRSGADSGAADNKAAFDAAIAVVAAADSGKLWIPPGEFQFTSALADITAPILIDGAGAGTGPGTGVSILTFAAGVPGPVFGAGSTGGAIKDLYLKSLSTVLGTDDGLTAKAGRLRIEDVVVEGFGRYGFSFDSTAANCNLSHVEKARAYANKSHGFYVAGADSNSIKFIGPSAVSNLGWGFYVNSGSVMTCVFLDPHADANTLGDYRDGGNSNHWIDVYSESGTFEVAAGSNYGFVTCGGAAVPTFITNATALATWTIIERGAHMYTLRMVSRPESALVNKWRFQMDSPVAGAVSFVNETTGLRSYSIHPTTELFTHSRNVKFDLDVEIDGALNHDGTTAGFYGATPVVKAASPGVAAGTDATVINAIITALRNLGLVT